MSDAATQTENDNRIKPGGDTAPENSVSPGDYDLDAREVRAWFDLGLPRLLDVAIRIRDQRNKAERELADLKTLISSPIVDDFMLAVPLEAAHQVERWGSEQDAGKNAIDWFGLVAYLAMKAVYAERDGDPDKYRHHLITTAAVLLNWHRRVQERALQTSAGMVPLNHNDAATGSDSDTP